MVATKTLYNKNLHSVQIQGGHMTRTLVEPVTSSATKSNHMQINQFQSNNAQ